MCKTNWNFQELEGRRKIPSVEEACFFFFSETPHLKKKNRYRLNGCSFQLHPWYFCGKKNTYSKAELNGMTHSVITISVQAVNSFRVMHL